MDSAVKRRDFQFDWWIENEDRHSKEEELFLKKKLLNLIFLKKKINFLDLTILEPYNMNAQRYKLYFQDKISLNMTKYK